MDICLDRKNENNFDGIIAVKDIRKFATMDELKIFMLSSFTDNINVVNATKAGANGYIYKSKNYNLLIERIKSKYEEIIAPVPSPYEHLQERLFIDNLFKFLSSRELEIIELELEGLLQKEISKKLKISEQTVKNTISKAYKKINVKNVYMYNLYKLKINDL